MILFNNYVLVVMIYLHFNIQPGFEILEVEGVKLNGKTHGEVVQVMAEAFMSHNQTLKLIVIPT